MKKTAERILTLTLFLIGLIMLFLICTPAIKAEPFIRTYDLLQDGIVEPIKNFTDSIQDGSGSINADTITADTITAAQLNIIKIDLTTISGTTALYLNLDVSDTADIKDLTADTITANKIVSKTLNKYIKKTDSIYADSIVSLALTKITGDTITKTELNDSLALKLNISDSVVITKISELQNDSNFASYNDTLFFQVSNSDTIYADTSITADTQMDVINDTSCFIIYGDSYNITLTDFDYSYKINVNGYWRESSQLVYLDEVNNRIVFKADINQFAIGTVKFNFWRVNK